MDSSIELLAYQRLAETGLSAAELLSMDMSEYARLTGRPPLGQVAAQAVEFEPPGRPRQEPAQSAPQPPEAQGIDIASLSMEEYAQLRGQLIGRSPKEGRGIFDSVGSRSDEYTAAVRAQSGRTGWNSSNVVESPRIDRQYVPQEQPDTRSAAQRFSTPGNVFGS